MATGSGLDAQFGFKAETTWGTAVTVDHVLEFNSESLTNEPTFLEPTGLRPGVKHKRESRVRVSRRTITGDVSMEVATRGMGTIWKHMLGSGAGSTPVQIAATTAYKQIHTPGGFVGFGLTMQVGRPEPSGTVRPFTFAGCKIPSWEFSLTDSEVPTLTINVDGRSEATATALATASYAASATVFDFSQATLTLGGTASTASGLTTVSGGTAATTIIREFNLSGESPMANERFGLGNAGLKAEPLENDTPTITGTLTAEFNKTEFYDVFTANTTFPLVLKLEGATIEASNKRTLEFLMPAVKIKAAAPTVDGPDVVPMNIDFEAYSNEVDPVIQIVVISEDAAL
jgi:hypothetical protein